MAKIKAFKGVRPRVDLTEKVISKPYDVLNTEEARVEAEGNPISFLHVVKSAIDLPPGADEYAPEVYEKAKENYHQLLDDGVLVQDEAPFLYLYEQEMDGHIQAGLVCVSAVSDYFDDVIKKHEFTRPVKEQDRINHIKTTGVHSGPIFLTYPDNTSIDALLNPVRETIPDHNVTTEDGVRHTLWVLKDERQTAQLVQLFQEEVPYTYIADGHHRAASSAKVGKALQEANPNHTGEEDYNWFLTVLFPASQLKIIDYNRVVKDLNGMSQESFLHKLGEHFEIIQHGSERFKPAAKRQIGMYMNGFWHELHPNEGSFDPVDPVNSLDVAILQNNVLDAILGISDPRTDERVEFVGGIRGLEELEKRVNSGEMQLAFALYPVSIDELMRIADSGEVMPPKSTWFEPKLRSGLVSNKFS